MDVGLTIVAVVTSAFVRAGYVFLKTNAVALLALRLLALAKCIADF